MSVFAAVVSRFAEKRLSVFECAAVDPVGSQFRVLRKLLGRAAETDWGRRHGYNTIRTPEQYRQRVPITDYKHFSPLWSKAADGARSVTWPGRVKYFACTSGTTSASKLIPVTHDALGSNRRSGALLVAFTCRRSSPDDVLSGKFLYLGGSTSLRPLGKGLVGDTSGIMARRIPRAVRRHYLPDRKIAAMSDWEAKIGRIVDAYLNADVCALSACPSWAAILFQQMRHAAQRLGHRDARVGDLWPRLSSYVSYGMAFEPYRPVFDEYIGRTVNCVETYSSSEAGLTAIQEEEGGPMRLIIDDGVFYEFVPVKHADDENPPRLHLGEVSEGEDYALLISSNGGIWSYPLGDVVRFETLRPPRIRFSGRSRLFLNAFGELVTLETIEKAIAAACKSTSASIVDYTVSPHFPTVEQATPAHHWIVEFDKPPDSDSEFASALDATLRRGSHYYQVHREHDFGMGPPVVTQVAPRTFYSWMKQRGQLGGQHKVPRVLQSDTMEEELLAVSTSLSAQ